MSHLERLPLHVLDRICTQLKSDGSGPSQLGVFALCSRHCYNASIPQRFSRAVFRVRDSSKFSLVFNAWNHLSPQDPRLRSLREVVVTRKPSFSDMLLSDRQRQNKGYHWGKGLYDYDVDEPDPVYDPMYMEPLRVGYGLLAPSPRMTEVWEAIARFVARIPRLSDFVIDHTALIPRCILYTIHETHPTCSLHIPNFGFPSLSQAAGREHNIDPYEREIATSKCLRSVGVKTFIYNGDGKRNYTREAVFEMVAYATPSLRHVYILDDEPGDSPQYRTTAFMSREPSQRTFFVDAKKTTNAITGSLRDLRLDRKGRISSAELEKWAATTNFEDMRQLQLCPVDIESLQTLYSLSHSSRLNSLHRLSLICYVTDNDQTCFKERLTLLLENLTPLELLALTGPLDSWIVPAIKEVHGCSLKYLTITHTQAISPERMPVISYEDLRSLVEHCPNIVSVACALRRRSGSPEEVRMYRLLGSWQRLKQLSLTLDCSILEEQTLDSSSSGECYTMDSSSPLSPEEARHLFGNMALDKNLAIAIYQKVFHDDHSKPRCRAGVLKLEIEATMYLPNGGSRTPSEIDTIKSMIGLSWLCRSDINYG